jgi:hypothetical protein
MQVLMLLAYGDESMDEKRKRVCAVAAIVGTKEQWEAIETAWLARTKGVPFHAKDCDVNPGRGDYALISHKENKELYKDLAIMLADSGLYGFGAAIDLAAQAAVFSGVPAAKMHGHSYFKTFIDVVEKIVYFVGVRQEIAELTFDNRIDIEHNVALLYANMRELNPGWQSHIASKLSFECSKDNPRLQMADLFAREVMKGLDNDLGPEKRPARKSWLALAETGRFSANAFGAEYFREVAADTANMAARLDFDPYGYRNWLGDRQDSLTAFIEYTRDRFNDLKDKG